MSTPNNSPNAKPCDQTYVLRMTKQWSTEGISPEEMRQRLRAAKCDSSLIDNYVAAPASPVSQTQTATQKNAQEAQEYTDQLKRFITQKQGAYLQDDAGEFSVLLDGKRIALTYEPDNHLLSGLLLKVCNITLHDYLARSVIERLIVAAHEATGKFTVRKFSAMSKDQTKLYIPLKDGKSVLLVTADGITPKPNGEGGFWLAHPDGDIRAGEALDYVDANPAEGLAEFERLMVNGMAVREPGMDWFLAMQETLFPFVREVNNDRIIPHHEGPQGSGKTTAAEASALLLGVKATGDSTAPSLNRIGDSGLLVMDNKESANFTAGFNGFVVYLATGTLSVRAQGEGYKARNQNRPVGVITSIEGAVKAETTDRMIRVSFNAHERNRSTFDKDAHYLEIKQKRDGIVSALVHVLQRFMQLKQEASEIQAPRAIDRFSGNYRTLVLLLRAYADTAQKGEGWVRELLAQWEVGMQTREEDNEGGDFQFLVEKFLRALNIAADVRTETPQVRVDDILGQVLDRGSKTITFKGQKGVFTKVTAGEMLAWLQSKEPFSRTLRDLTPAGFGRRLRNLKLENAQVLTEEDLPTELARTKHQRFLGLFEPD